MIRAALALLLASPAGAASLTFEDGSTSWQFSRPEQCGGFETSSLSLQLLGPQSGQLTHKNACNVGFEAFFTAPTITFTPDFGPSFDFTAQVEQTLNTGGGIPDPLLIFGGNTEDYAWTARALNCAEGEACSLSWAPVDAPAPIPLPAGVLLLGGALAGLLVLRRRG